MAIVILVMMVSFMPSHVMAQPTAYECLENPVLEGCPSSESTGDSQESPVGEEESGTDEGTSLVWNIIKLIFALIFVIALIYGLLKFFNQKNKLFSQNKTMENLGGMNLGPNRSIQAVRIGRQVFILGVGESVEMISEITDETTKETLLNRDEQAPGHAADLLKWTAKMKKDKGPTENSSIQFQQLFEKQLNDMKDKRKRMMDKQRRGSGHE
ncbi:flagellar biosynthetic protein FliO [Halobacillus dabanensis]|uniref:flagellar biosynthetic protein FliO n=1 Tax=Halobacillus dabanensis TaxID=240302 RepID=UPI001428AD76|nr:flagellar biosynthetic protein FliO [Halobacillus dabanensis]